MTIVAGFRCSTGIVLCADTQETVGIAKRHVPKLRFESTPLAMQTLGAPDLAIAFCGATNNGAFVDKLIDLACTAAWGPHSIDEVCVAIEDSIKNTFREFATICQLGYMPTADLIYGVKMKGRSRLFNASDAFVNEKSEYCIGGVGTYLADFLAARMFTAGLTVQQCVILAAYILFQTKEHVDGCGGKSHIAILEENAPCGLVDEQRVKSITENLQRADSELGGLILASSNLDLSNDDFEKQANDVFDFLKMYREEQRKDFGKWENFRRSFDAFYGLTVKRNSLGLTLSVDNTEKPEPEQ